MQAAATGWHTKHGGEELLHVRGQGRWLGGANLHPRSGATSERSYPTSEARGRAREEPPGVRSRGGGQEEPPSARGQGLRPEGATPTPQVRGRGWEDQPHVQGAVAAWAQEGLEEPSHVEGQEGRW